MDEAFPEMDELSEQCRFRDCSHGPEPGCAVQAAVAEGRVSVERFAAWRTLRDEAAAVVAPAAAGPAAGPGPRPLRQGPG